MEETSIVLDPMAWSRFCPELKGMLVFSKVWGSRSHNTQMPESDTDYLAVYLAWNKELLSLDPPIDSFDQEYVRKHQGEPGIPAATEDMPDFQVHEVGKFAQLLLKGNPGIVEMLYTERMIWFDPKWKPLVENRGKFLCKKAVESYLGYAGEQMKKLARGSGLHSKGGVYGEKWGYHMYRIVLDALRIAQGGEPVVWKEGKELEDLMAIRRGEWSKDRMQKETTEVIGKVEALKPWPIPDEADKAFLNDWVLRIRGLSSW
jgi:hypothetical protein